MPESIFDMMQRGVAQHNQQVESEGGTVRPAQAQIPTEYMCPQCDVDKKESRLISSPARTGLFCLVNPDHQYRDIEELRALKPRIVPLKGKVAGPPPGATDFTVKVRPQIQAAVKERFGARVDTAVDAVLGAMCDPKAFIITSLDLPRLHDKLGDRVNSPQSLLGAIFELSERARAAEQENTVLRKSQGGTKGSYVANPEKGEVVVNLEGLKEQLAEKFACYPSFEEGIRQTLKLALDNGWL